MNCFVYLIQSRTDKSFYVGISEDPEKRLVEHNSGKTKSISKKRPYSLIYKKEYPDRNLGRKHEIWLKKKGVDYKSKLAQISRKQDT